MRDLVPWPGIHPGPPALGSWNLSHWIMRSSLFFDLSINTLSPVLLPGKSHGWRSLVGCSPWGHKEQDTTERLHFHFSLSFIGDGNGSPLQCSCLENPRDEGVWWAAVYGVAQSRTWLKQLSSSSSSSNICYYTSSFNVHPDVLLRDSPGRTLGGGCPGLRGGIFNHQ